MKGRRFNPYEDAQYEAFCKRVAWKRKVRVEFEQQNRDVATNPAAKRAHVMSIAKAIGARRNRPVTLPKVKFLERGD